MFFLLSALAVVAETAAAITGGVLAATGQIGSAIVAGTVAIGGIAGAATVEMPTSVGIEAATATALGTIAAGGTTTALNIGIVEAGRDLVKSDAEEKSYSVA